MEHTYAPQKQQETASPEKKPLESQGPSMAALRSGAAMPTPGQKGQQVSLPDAMRAKTENAFGADLSAVKLYESKAVADAGAQAITQGSEIAFAPGMLDFTSHGGQALLGHEISHVVSQARGEVSRSGGFLNDSALEARADREGAMAAAGQQIAMPTAALSTVTAAPASAPMQAKKKSKEKAAAPAPAQQAPAAAAPAMPTFSAEDQARANDVLTGVTADQNERNSKYQALLEQYQAAHPDAQSNAVDPRQKRFLQRFMTGSDEENAALFNNVMAQGDKAMIPTFISTIRRVNSFDSSPLNSKQGLMAYGKDALNLSRDNMNMSDMIFKDKRITLEMLYEGGLSEEEFAAYNTKRHDMGAGTSLAQQRLKYIQRGADGFSSPEMWNGFDNSDSAPADEIDSVAKSTEDFDTYADEAEIDRLAMSTEEFEKAYGRKKK